MEVLFPTIPDRVDGDDVARIESATRRARAADYREGGGACRDTVLAHLAGLHAVLAADAADSVHTRLLVAVADLHNLAGWTCFDTGHPAAARGQFRQALALAHRAGHRDLAANICYRLGRVHLHHHEPAHALTLFQAAELLAEQVGSGHTVSLLAANRAWAHAVMGNTGQALSALAHAHDTFPDTGRADTAPWTAFFDRTDLAAITGTVHTELARHLDPHHSRAAIPALTTAVAGYSDTMARSRTLCRAMLATCHLIDGDLDQGANTGRQAFAEAQRLASPRTRQRLEALAAEAHRHRHHRDVRTLAYDLTTLRLATPHQYRDDERA